MLQNRKYFIYFFFALPGLIYIFRLLQLQIISDSYKKYAYDNTTRRVVEYPYRGLIYDRNGTLLTLNEPVFDIMIDPKKAKISDTTSFIDLLNIKNKTLDSFRSLRGRKPKPLIKELSQKKYAKISNALVRYPGIYVNTRAIRGYKHQSLANVLGYINEVSPQLLKKDTSRFYKAGDYIGISGLEKQYEHELRGKRGVKYNIVNVYGSYKGDYMNGKSDTLSTPGNEITISIDLKLQQYAEKLMNGKRGSVVIIEPKTGEILTMVSAPSYKPSLLTGQKSGEHFYKLNKDTLKPLFNRALQAVYPPGSIFKTIQALVALHIDAVTPEEIIRCDNRLIGDHAPRGKYNLAKAIKYSSNNYFYIIFKRMIEQGIDPNPFKDASLGLENWHSFISKFGLGHKLGIDIPNEKRGFIPNSKYYDRYYKKNGWRMRTIYSLSIGQGELQLTPLQMANLAVIIANKGWYIKPHFIKKINNANIQDQKFEKKNNTRIDHTHFEPVIDGMVQALKGTAQRAIIKDIEICGKTGTVENPPNPDHSVFMCFAPRANPQLAISVYVENAGWGGRAAASVASLLVEYYIKKKISRKKLEDYVLKGDFSK